LRAHVPRVILLAIIRSNGDEMRYIPDWETLAEILTRVMTTNGLSMSEARLDICRALRDGKLRTRYTVERVQTPYGIEVNRQAFGQPRSPFDQRDIIGRPRVPPNLIPDDIDWKNSRPKSQWLDNRRFVVGIAKIEVSTADAILVLCGGRTDRPASDSVLGGSPAPEPVPTPKIDIASADQVALPRRRRSAKRGRVQRAIDEEYPGGVPEEITDMELLAAVGRKLGRHTPSLETVRRAAGRRSK
jgi:hypothetical protein